MVTVLGTGLFSVHNLSFLSWKYVNTQLENNVRKNRVYQPKNMQTLKGIIVIHLCAHTVTHTISVHTQIVKIVLMRQWGHWSRSKCIYLYCQTHCQSLGIFGHSLETVSIFTKVKLCNRLLTWKLGNNYHEAAPWQQKIMSLTCTYANRHWYRLCRLFMQLQCSQCPQGECWSLTLHRLTAVLLDLAVCLQRHTSKQIIENSDCGELVQLNNQLVDDTVSAEVFLNISVLFNSLYPYPALIYLIQKVLIEQTQVYLSPVEPSN